MEQAVILFDGVCNFCNASVNFVIRHDRRNHFRFAPLQSAAGRALQTEYGLNPDALNTFILVENGKSYGRSDAALKVVRRLGFPLNITYAFIVVPRFLRDSLYNFAARNRYKWFGKKDACMVPDERLRRKFL